MGRKKGRKRATHLARSPGGVVQERRLRDNSWLHPDNQREFLEWLASTCNVRLSAQKAGLCPRGGYRLRLADAHFREQWERALQEGHQRLYEMLCTVASEGMEKVCVQGGRADPDLKEQSVKLCQWLLSRHKNGWLRGAAQEAAKRRPITTEELKANINSRLDAVAERLRATGRAPPLASPLALAAGAPPATAFVPPPPPPPQPPFAA